MSYINVFSHLVLIDLKELEEARHVEQWEQQITRIAVGNEVSKTHWTGAPPTFHPATVDTPRLATPHHDTTAQTDLFSSFTTNVNYGFMVIFFVCWLERVMRNDIYQPRKSEKFNKTKDFHGKIVASDFVHTIARIKYYLSPEILWAPSLLNLIWTGLPIRRHSQLQLGNNRTHYTTLQLTLTGPSEGMDTRDALWDAKPASAMILSFE